MRRSLALVLAGLALPALAHHGIIWTDKEPVSITGEIVSELSGNPHFEVSIQVGDERWDVDLGNTYRLKKAGLGWDGGALKVGTEITVDGLPAADEDLHLIRARTIWIGGEPHRLYDEGEPIRR